MTSTTFAEDTTFVNPEEATSRLKTTVFNIGMFASRSVRRGLAFGSGLVSVAMLFAVPYAAFVVLAAAVSAAFTLAPAVGWAVITLMAASAITTLFRLGKKANTLRVVFAA